MSVEEVQDPRYVADHELRQQGRAVRPKDAATLLIVRRGGAEPRVLMGKRAASHRFMPNKFVFPGGRVDPGDSRIRPPHDLHPQVLRRLCRGCSATRARALALAAIRETYEETGLVVGEPDTPTLRSRSPAWADFLRHDANPRLDVLHYIARAITPPYRNRRFDARFFMVDAEHIQGEVHERPHGSGELLDLHWVALSRAREMEQLPHITRAVLQELQRRLREGHAPDTEGPFVYSRRGRSVVERV
ncbi:MAG: NUDIX hydrolase [Halioglobus sp.]|nr:NUDIX hydrolase [Halioglobus sp.]|tara:strand:- start:251 stop:988 length:738 start_codon:yes stop_codon:yes gene_type:complete